VVFEDEYKQVTSDEPKTVNKGEELGHFAHGGSTVLLIFERGRFNSVTVQQGQRKGKSK
jgi:phosphatidylserine decarboxylase